MKYKDYLWWVNKVSGKTDLRVLKTHENIINAFSNLLLQKSFKDITVQNICDEAVIGRSTFYDHYYDKYDLLSKTVEEALTEFKGHIQERFNLAYPGDFTKTCSNIFSNFEKEKKLIRALLNVHTETINFYDEVKNILIEECYSYLKSNNFVSKYKIPNEFICRHYASYVLTSFELWLEFGEMNPALEMADKMQKLLFERA